MPPRIELRTCARQEYEEHIIGSIMRRPKETIERVSFILQPSMFYFDGYRITFELALDLYHRGIMPDKGALLVELEAKGLIPKVGGADAIAQLLDAADRDFWSGEVESYATAIREQSIYRNLQESCLNVLAAVDRETPLERLLSEASAQIYAVANSNINDQAVEGLPELMEGYVEKRLQQIRDSGGTSSYISYETGINRLNRAIKRYQPSELTVWAGRPGTGKTRVGGHSLATSALAGHRVGFISFDMHRQAFCEYIGPTISAILGDPISPRDIYEAGGSMMGETRLMDLLGHSRKYAGQFYAVTKAPNKSMAAVESYMRKMVERGVQVVFFDQCQRVSEWQHALRTKNRGLHDWVVEQFKSIAENYELSIILAHQINRGGIERPRIQDLKETGAFEELADNVVLFHDEQSTLVKEYGGFMYDEESCRARAPKAQQTPQLTSPKSIRPVDIQVAKTRHGPVCEWTEWFDYEHGYLPSQSST